MGGLPSPTMTVVDESVRVFDGWDYVEAASLNFLDRR
jgi:hypothetical protein